MYKTFWTLLVIILICSCQKTEEPVTTPQYPQSGHNLTAAQLAKAYCGACHEFPEPNLLSKSLWTDKVLKDMGRRLGVVDSAYDPFFKRSMRDSYILRSAGIYPSDTMITNEDWQKIVEYYRQEAPETPLAQNAKQNLDTVLRGFDVVVFDSLPQLPLTTLVKFDTTSGSIMWGSRRGDLIEVNAGGKVLRHLLMNSAISHMLRHDGYEYYLTMGIMDPSEEAVGSMLRVNGDTDELTTVINNLQRPVYFEYKDLNHDGKLDFIISQFGDQTGKLGWFEKVDTGYVQHIIKPVPGVIKTVTDDFNKDGWLDVMALQTQGDEGISIFYGQDDFKFREKRVLRFPPVYGSSSFELADFNGDGYPDILYTCGDNADHSYSLKAYHGLRIFLNDGAYNFQESYFYPMYGAMNAKSLDYDLDGDLDIAVISFFPEFNAPQPESFVLLQNQGEQNFKPFTFPEAVNGRWLTLDVSDYDQDGDEDIVLGSLLFTNSSIPSALINKWGKSNYHMILLKNSVN